MQTTTYLGADETQKEITTINLFNDVINRLNAKEIGTFDTKEILTGQSWFNENNQTQRKGAYRKVFVFPSLTAIGTTSVAHGLGDISGFTFTRITGTAKNAAGTLHVSLPQGGPNSVMLTVNANNINIICATATYNTFSAIVVLEYLKN